MPDIDEYPLHALTPPSISGDSTISGLIDVIDPRLVSMARECGLPIILPHIDLLPENVLDLLLWQFHITFDEGAGLAVSVGEKRELLKKAVEIHRLKGTKAALLGIFDMFSMRGKISEWYEYGGEPYRFRIDILEISDRGLDEQTYDLLERLIGAYKNARSWLDVLNVYLITKSKVPEFAIAGQDGEEITVYPYDIAGLCGRSCVYGGLGIASVEETIVYPL